MHKEIVIGTSNPGKLKEYRDILAPLGYVVYGEKDLNITCDPVENGQTYRENSLIKARAISELVKWPVLSDDSGIEIEGMGNKPGIFSARYAKEQGGYPKAFEDIYKHLKQTNNWKASFHCCICYLESKEAKPLFFEGVCPGLILPKPVGEHGFGYDPIFHCNEANVDFGTCDEDIKNKFSHRSKALAKLVVYLSI
jgi:XTP/dITP diphosphohydrolase